MIDNKILIRVNQISDIEFYQENNINNFVFALEGYSIGYPTFKLEEIKDINANIYLLINKIFDKALIEKFKKESSNLKFIKGLFFDDLGIYNILKDKNILLIWDQSHFVINSKSINSWLNRVHSACLSSELTLSEIQYILTNTIKPIILPVLGNNMAMYSRRLLLDSYTSYKGFKSVNKAILKTKNNQIFKTYQNEDGTVLFYNQIFNYLNYLNELDDNKILFYYINLIDKSSKEVMDIIKGKVVDSDEMFLINKTIYKIGDN